LLFCSLVVLSERAGDDMSEYLLDACSNREEEVLCSLLDLKFLRSS
jgi:hypothetical protein